MPIMAIGLPLTIAYNEEVSADGPSREPLSRRCTPRRAHVATIPIGRQSTA
jgi:hypothetical protein